MAIASTNVANRKLFVRGLAWETSSETLLAAFEQYGEIEEGAVITDRTTGRSRGFGFVTFKSSESAYRALREPTKMIDGRAAMCNLAAAGPTSHPTATSVAAASSHGGGDSGYQYRPSYSSGADLVYRKLYVWGLHFDTTNETFKDYFSQYGEIEEGAVAFDRETHKSRGFGFVTYRSADDARKALVEPTKFIDGRKVQVKYALDGTKEKNAFAQAQAQLQQQQQLAAALTGVALQNPLAFSPYAFPGGLPASAFGSAGLQGMGFPTAATAMAPAEDDDGEAADEPPNDAPARTGLDFLRALHANPPPVGVTEVGESSSAASKKRRRFAQAVLPYGTPPAKPTPTSAPVQAPKRVSRELTAAEKAEEKFLKAQQLYITQWLPKFDGLLLDKNEEGLPILRCSICVEHGKDDAKFGRNGTGGRDLQLGLMRFHELSGRHDEAMKRQRTLMAEIEKQKRIDDFVNTDKEGARLTRLMRGVEFICDHDAPIAMFPKLIC
ncbi:unnamed protein product [Closterium sp. Yama58-4]|nr:unnamed protein product [Closterium sp. Yama58-4]